MFAERSFGYITFLISNEYNYCQLPIFQIYVYMFVHTYLYPHVDLESGENNPNNLCQQ